MALTPPPEGYLGASARIRSGPAPELVEAGYALELADAPLLHRGLSLADLAQLVALDEASVLPPQAAPRLAAALLELLDTEVTDVDYDPLYGDAYNSRERILTTRLGDVAGWLHTGRTRREAGRIAFRIALRAGLDALATSLVAFTDAVVAQAREHATTLIDDTTYLQPAQPSTFGHYLLTFAEEAVRHLERTEAATRWADRSPGGVGGVGGTRIPLDRDRLAELLGFAAVGAHTRDVMWSTDGLVDAAVAAAQAANTTDRLAEDLEILTSPPYGVVRLPASLCRASVMLPQKRNPYALAVLRGGAGTLIGRATGLMVTQRTPSARTDNWLYAYGEVAGALELARRLVDLARAAVAGLEVDVARLAARVGEQFTVATDVTDELVLRTGIDYRRVYRVVGAVAARAGDDGRDRFDEGDLEAICAELRTLGASVEAAELTAVLDPAAIVAGRTARGGSAAEAVRARCDELTVMLEAHRGVLDARRRRIEDAEVALIAAVRRMAR